MAKKQPSEEPQPAVHSIFDEMARESQAETPVEVGIKLFESVRGNSITGIYMGIRDISREEMKDPEIPEDNRRKTIPTAYIRTSEYVAYRTGNESAVQHFRIIEPGSYVKLECLQRGVKGEQRSEFSVKLIFTPGQVAERFMEPYDMIQGFLM